MRNPFKELNKTQWIIWINSLFVIILSSVLAGSSNSLTVISSLIGVTALIFVAKGDVWGQILTVVFSIFYGIISLKFKYYGEMITYLGMTMPIAVLSIISWLKHPYKGSAQVKVNHLSKKQLVLIALLTIVVTIAFYFILKALNTANLIVSTISIATSFCASFLMMMRSPLYALAYAANDVVLIILWIMASIESISYMPMILCFIMFLINDIYGFINWQKMKKQQK